MKSLSVSTFLRFMIGFAVILFVGTLAFHPDLMEWLRIHPAWDAVAVLAGTIFHWWNTYHRSEAVHGR